MDTDKQVRRLCKVFFLLLVSSTVVMRGAEGEVGLLDRVVSDTQAVSREIRLIRQIFVKQCCGYFETRHKRKRALPVTKYAEFVAQHAKSYPFFLLEECGKNFDIGGGRCPLDRSVSPGYRKAYEDKVVPVLSSKLRESPKAVHMVSVGSGGMFQDFVIVAKAIRATQQTGKSDVVVHCIDPNYSFYVKNLSTPRIVEGELPVCASGSISKETLGNAVLGSVSQQFLTALNRVSSPDTTVFFCMYKSAKAFRSYQKGKFNAD